jgi:hypothetical protein
MAAFISQKNSGLRIPGVVAAQKRKAKEQWEWRAQQHAAFTSLAADVATY